MAKTATGVLDKPKTSTATKRAATKSTTARRNARRRDAAETNAASAKSDTVPKKTTHHSKELSARGEEAAARFLAHRGYDILERNWTCYAGEVDIIATDEDCIVFVEVQTRRDTSRGFPSNTFTESKRKRYEKIAIAYLEKTQLRDLAIRFDIISIVVIGSDRAMIRHQINALRGDAAK